MKLRGNIFGINQNVKIVKEFFLTSQELRKFCSVGIKPSESIKIDDQHKANFVASTRYKENFIHMMEFLQNMSILLSMMEKN